MRFWSGIDHTQKLEQDVRLDLANLIYRYGDIRGMDLALRIYHSDGDIELSDDEFIIFTEFCIWTLFATDGRSYAGIIKYHLITI